MVSEIKNNDFQNCLFGHGTWPLAKVPQVAHISSFYPKGSKMRLTSLMGRFSKQFQNLHICSLNFSRVTNFIQFCSRVARFLDNWSLCFLHRYNGEFEILEKQIVKNHKLKNPQSSFVKTMGRKIQGKFETLAAICRKSGVLKFALRLGPMLTKWKKIIKISISKFQKSQTTKKSNQKK